MGDALASDAFVVETVELWNHQAKGGTLWLWGAIEQPLVHNIAMHLHDFSQDDNRKVIVLRINSCGGDLYAMFALADAMRSTGKIVQTVVSGQACSGACVVAACGSQPTQGDGKDLLGHRAAMPNATFMFHGMSATEKMTLSSADHVANADEWRRLDALMCDLMGNTTRKKSKWWQSIVDSGRDFYFGADEAVKLGVVDGIL
jgi:ATP-dependent Clp protease, protease subunit